MAPAFLIFLDSSNIITEFKIPRKTNTFLSTLEETVHIPSYSNLRGGQGLNLDRKGINGSRMTPSLEHKLISQASSPMPENVTHGYSVLLLTNK